MATLPRMHSKHNQINHSISTPFSTSPRKLQEMSPPTLDGHHDITNASGLSMKQYEEQLNSLRKENFHLKLRIYFLEEKLGTGSPPAVQGLLEHNVRLQVEVEELRRQLSDKQELLAAAAEAIDVLEQQGSISNDSVETSMNNSIAVKKESQCQAKNMEKKDDIDDTCGDSETTVDYLAATHVNNNEMDELVKLRRENRKALQMIKGCMVKLQQQDKEIKKLKLDKELVYAHVSDSQLEKYEEILKCKDEHIKDLESKIRDLQKNMDIVQNDDAGNLQQLLTRRLQGLAFFLDKLLAHKCVLGEDKKKLAESILEQSLALPVGLKLDETMAPEELTMDESAFDMSQSLRLEDLTAMLGHHGGPRGAASGAAHRQRDERSESESWSEPDRGVSLARVGRCDTGRRRPDLELLHDENDHLAGQLARCEADLADLAADHRALQHDSDQQRADLEATRSALRAAETRAKELEWRVSEAERAADCLRDERDRLEAARLEVERGLRRAADEAALQASQAALQRARAHHDAQAAEAALQEARASLQQLRDEHARLQLQLSRTSLARLAHLAPSAPSAPSAPASDDDRPTSPDQGIDSDRLSSLEQNDHVTLSPDSLYEENVVLKQKLTRTKATLAETLAQLNAANMRKRNVQRAICREIHKTHGVLRKARDQFENQS